MANKFIIPSVFTAVDQMSPKMSAMRHSVVDFGNRAEASIAKADRVFRKLTPALGAAQKQLLSMVGTGAMVAGAFQLGNFSFRSLQDYEVALDSFHTIVSDLNDADFAKFQNKIDEVAKHSGRSSVEVAQAFEKIAGLNATFAESSEGIGSVTEATITLAKAARMDLGVAAENLVGIMNQFSFGATEASRTINTLAAGQAAGAASITQTAEAFTVFGSIAAGSNITLEQSVGLIQTLGKYSLFGAEAGTKLRGAILRLQKAGIGYASGQFDVNDALNQTNGILAKMHTAKQKDAIINKLFGAENVTAGRILLNNIDTFNKYTQEVTGTTEAQKAAGINSGNLKTAVDELGAAWVNMITGTSGAKDATSKLTSATQWLTENLSTVVDTTITAIKWYAIIKGSLFAARAAMTAWNVTLGISSAITGASSLAMKANTVALAAQSTALTIMNTSTKGATIGQLGLNAAMAANPVGLLVLGFTALAAGVGYLLYRQKELTAEYKQQLDLRVNAHINAQADATKALAKRWQDLGHNIHDATVKSLQFQVMQAGQNLDAAKAKKAAAEANLVAATDNALFPAFSPEVSRAQEELQAANQGVTMASAGKLGATNSVFDAMRSGIIKATEAQGIMQGKSFNIGAPAQHRTVEAQKLSSTDMQAIDKIKEILGASMNSTITIKNESDNQVQMSQGDTKLVDVQPKTASTKRLRAAF